MKKHVLEFIKMIYGSRWLIASNKYIVLLTYFLE